MASEYMGPSAYRGVPAFQYQSNFGDVTKNPNLKCFCESPEKCLKKGVMDLFKCQGAPLVASLPHFLDADPEYINGVKGLHPDKEKHGIIVKLEPLTGTPLWVRKRLQFSQPIHPVSRIDLTENLTETLVPFLWVEESMELTDLLLAELDEKLFKPLRNIDIMKWVMTAAGACITGAGAALNFINPFSSKGDGGLPSLNKIFTVNT